MQLHRTCGADTKISTLHSKGYIVTVLYGHQCSHELCATSKLSALMWIRMCAVAPMLVMRQPPGNGIHVSQQYMSILSAASDYSRGELPAEHFDSQYMRPRRNHTPSVL